MLLASDGIDVNKARTDYGGTPLFAACEKGHTEVVAMLLACDGIDVNKVKTDTGATVPPRSSLRAILVTPGQWGCCWCDGVDINKATNGTTPRCIACDSGWLLGAGFTSLLPPCSNKDGWIQTHNHGLSLH
jgi:ankyrin repeat protein